MVMALKCKFCGRFMRWWAYTKCPAVNGEGKHFVCDEYEIYPRLVYEDVMPEWL